MVKSELYGRRIQQFEQEVTLYPVCCEKLSADRSDREWLDQVLKGGAKIVQLRDKESCDADLLEKAHYFRRETTKAGALFLLNDRLDIALLADADGLHVGQNDLPPDAIRRLMPDAIIGLSCNTLEQTAALGCMVEKNKCSASYFNIGPIYETGTKEGLKAFLGPESIEQFSGKCSLPFTVMGGIKYKHIPELIAAGAKRIAVVTELTMADNIAGATTNFIAAMAEEREKTNG